MPLRDLFVEVRRRKVLRACAMYIVGAWVAVQVAGMLFPAINVPEEALLYVWLIAVSLFPLAVIFSWRYDVSIEGITRTPPARPSGCSATSSTVASHHSPTRPPTTAGSC